MSADIDVHRAAGAYALDALPADERAAFEAHLDRCADCRAEVRELQATAARLGSTQAVAPPPQLRERVLAEVARTRQDAPVVDLATRRRTRRRACRSPWRRS